MPQYDMDSGITNTLTNTQESFSFTEVWIIISVLLAVIGGIYLFSNLFNKNKDNTYTGFKKAIYDFVHFKITIIEPTFKVLYLISAITLTLSSLTYLTTNFFKFVAVLIFGNLILRLSYELLLLVLKLFKDVSEINAKMIKDEKKKKTVNKEKEEIKEI